MPIRIAPWSAAALAAVILLGGCMGEPQTFYTAKPIVLEPRATPPIRVRPVRTAPAAPAPALSAAEKEKLFQRFQQSRTGGNRTIMTSEAPP